MIGTLPRLDHVLIGARDPASARAAWQRLGFIVGGHRDGSAADAGGAILLQGDHLELVSAAEPGSLRRPDASAEGLIALALATGDAAGTPLGAGLGVAVLARGHRSPEPLRRPDGLRHPNGARCLRVLTAAVPDPAAAAPAWRRLLGDDAVTLEAAGLSVRLGAVILHIGPSEPGLEGLLGLGVEVDDLAAAGRHLEQAGARFRHTGDSLDIDPREATGVALSLLQG